MKRVFKKPYVYWIIAIFISYLFLAVYFSQFYTTAKFIPYYLNTIHWPRFVLALLFTLMIAFLVAVNSTYSYIKYQERKNIRKASTLTCAAALGGLTTGVCPACAATLLYLPNFLGISFTYSSLPFQGLEIQAALIIILIVSLYFVSRG